MQRGTRYTVRIVLPFALGFLLLGHFLFAASPGSTLEKAKKDAEAKSLRPHKS
jgi:hypothetical protein